MNNTMWVLLAAAQSQSPAERYAGRPDLAFAYVMAILILVAWAGKSIMDALKGKKTPADAGAVPAVPAPPKGTSRGAKVALGCVGVLFLFMVIAIVAGR